MYVHAGKKERGVRELGHLGPGPRPVWAWFMGLRWPRALEISGNRQAVEDIVWVPQHWPFGFGVGGDS